MSDGSDGEGEVEIPRIIDAGINPVTKSIVTISPPVEITDVDDMMDIGRAFIRVCEEAWHDGRDLRHIDDLRGYVHAS